MRVSAAREVLRRAKWHRGSFKNTYVGKEATVTKVQAAQALVRWLAAAPVWGSDGPDDEKVSVQPPIDMQRPSKLLELTQHHARSCWRLAEHAILRHADVDALLAEQAEKRGEAPPKLKGKKRKNTPVDMCAEVSACHTRVDVVWQDGTRDTDGAATAYAPAKHVDGYYEFWPQDYVVGKADEPGGSPPVGVIESVNHDQRLCYVTWRGSSSPGPEIVPVYEIGIHAAAPTRGLAGGCSAHLPRVRIFVWRTAPHPDFNFKVGDIVLRLPKSHDPNADDAPDAPAPDAPVPAEPAPAPMPPSISVEEDVKEQAKEHRKAVAAAAAASGEGDADGDGDDEGEEGAEVSAATASSLRAIGEVVAVGKLLTVRWMDGSLGEIEPEEAYVVNTEEEDGTLAGLDVCSPHRCPPLTAHPSPD